VISNLTNSLQTFMDMLSMRQKLVSSNIANADTPGYKTQDIDMNASFHSMLTGGLAQQADVGGLTVKNDGNNVDLDREARLLAENSMRFNMAATLMKSQIAQVREAIKEGPA
jgi:flagellar basal-body rod protein FlgB